MNVNVSDEDRDTLRQLEEELWREDTRYDRTRMEEVLAEDFFEFGRSGKRYGLDDILAFPREPIEATIPLPKFDVHLLHPDVALVTYVSVVTYKGDVLRANRSSLWSRIAGRWRLRFHQGTDLGHSAE